jgi:hypothetical protein
MAFATFSLRISARSRGQSRSRRHGLVAALGRSLRPALPLRALGQLPPRRPAASCRRPESGSGDAPDGRSGPGLADEEDPAAVVQAAPAGLARHCLLSRSKAGPWVEPRPAHKCRCGCDVRVPRAAISRFNYHIGPRITQPEKASSTLAITQSIAWALRNGHRILSRGSRQEPGWSLYACCVSELEGPNWTACPAARAAECCLSSSVPGVA